jgi:hypothetical protein
MVSLPKAMALITTVVALVLAVSGVSILGVWNAAGPILTYEIPPGGLGFEWGAGPVTSHVTVELRNLGWLPATQYRVDITVSGNITGCHMVLGNSHDQMYDCTNGFPSGVQVCGTENMLVMWGQNTVSVFSSRFPAGCDLILIIDSAAPFSTIKVTGDSDQTQIESLGEAQSKIVQRNFSFWVLGIVGAILVASVASLVIVTLLNRKHFTDKLRKRPRPSRRSLTRSHHVKNLCLHTSYPKTIGC